MNAAFFDVDGTLCATRSTTSLVWHRERQTAPWRHCLWRASLLWKAPAAWLADQVSRELADRIVYREFRGLSEARLAEDAVRCRDELLLPTCHPQALAAIQEHRAAGLRIVLLSGGIDLVLRPLADALGAELVAQRLVSIGGRLTGEHRGYSILEGTGGSRGSQGAKKVAALRRYAAQNGVDLSGSFAYGDSVNDAPVLSAVGNPVAVNPDRRLARMARDSGWEVRRWSIS